MQLEKVWSGVPNVKIHIYCARRNQFLLKEDSYNDWAMFIVEDGVLQYETGGKQETAKAGEMVIFPPGMAVRRKAVTPLTFHFIRFSWPEQQDAPTLAVGKIKLSNGQRLQSTLAQLRKAANINNTFAEVYRSHLLRDIWMLYGYELCSAPPADNMRTKNTLLNQAVDYIHTHVYEKMNVKAVAKLVGLTAVQFERKFKREFSVAPKEYVTSLRLQKAKTLLTDTKMTLAEIAGQCGYDNEYYFSNVFKKHFQIAPSRYRSIHRL